jgi:hypothetical protein
VDKVAVGLLVGFDGARSDDGGDSSDCLLQVVLINPRIELLYCCGESVLEDYVGPALTFEVELCWVNVGVAQGLELFDGWFF